MRKALFLLSLALAPSTLLAATPAPVYGASTDASLSTDFTLDTKTLIPGKTLSPGQYTISVVDHLTDRVILKVVDKKGKVESTFLGLTSPGLPAASSAGPVRWNGKGTVALRGFLFPGAPPVEFGYPKTQAVTIAKGNSDKVLAVDPASDNLSIQHDQLSNQDMQIVTLWTLKSTRVGPDSEPAIEAAKYQPPTPAATAQPAYVAHADSAPERAPSSASASRPAPTQVASNSPAPAPQRQTAVRKPTVAVLPHTASNLPLMMLASLLALFVVIVLRISVFYTDEA